MNDSTKIYASVLMNDSSKIYAIVLMNHSTKIYASVFMNDSTKIYAKALLKKRKKSPKQFYSPSCAEALLAEPFLIKLSGGRICKVWLENTAADLNPHD